MLIAEAIDTLITLGRWFVAWLAVLAALASIVLLAGTAAGMWAGRLLWRRAGRPAWARTRTQARRYARSRRDYDEAA